MVVTIDVDEADPNHSATTEDYTLSTNRTLTVQAGSMRSTAVVTLTAADDEYYGPPVKKVALEIASVTGIDRSSVVEYGNWVITDDESQPRVTLDVTPPGKRGEPGEERGGQTAERQKVEPTQSGLF